jgi:hypothetical protein
MLKFLFSKPVDWFAPRIICDSQFTVTFKRFVQFIVSMTAILVALDLILAQIRFGNFSLQSGLYYGALFLCMTIMLLVIRPNAETSLKQMRKSDNVLIRTGVYLLFIGISIISFFVQAISNLLGEIAKSDINSDIETLDIDEGIVTEKSDHESEFMMGGRDDPPGPFDYKGW